MKAMGGLNALVKALGNKEFKVKHPALRALGNVVTGSDEQTQDVVNMGVLEKLLPILELGRNHYPQNSDNNDNVNFNSINYNTFGSSKKNASIVKEACWMISNITAGTVEQIDAVIGSDIVPILVELLRFGPYEIKKEAGWAISNATSGGNKRQIQYFVHKGVIKPLCDLLESGQAKILLVAMEGLQNILKAGEELAREKYEGQMKSAQLNGEIISQQIEFVNEYAEYVEQAKGLDRV